MKKSIMILLILGIIIFLIYHSITIQSLSEYKKIQMGNQFNPLVYAESYWTNTVQPGIEEALPLNFLHSILKNDDESAFQQYGNAISIGNIGYFLIKSSGKVLEINENEIILLLEDGNEVERINLATEFIFGNAVRDVFGAIDLNEFESTADLNKVSEEINKIIRAKVVAPFLQEILTGDSIEFVGVIELNNKHLNFRDLEAIPLSISILSGQ
jgi:predicted lipoprotein